MVDAVAAATGVSRIKIIGADRTAEVSRARHAVYYVLQSALGWSQVRIGAYFGRDHTTVGAGLRRAMLLRAANPDLDALHDQLLGQFAGQGR